MRNTDFRNLPQLLARAHRALQVVRDPRTGTLCVKTVGPQPAVVGIFSEREDYGSRELLLTLEAGQDWSELLSQLAALLHEREAGEGPDVITPGAQVASRLQ